MKMGTNENKKKEILSSSVLDFEPEAPEKDIALFQLRDAYRKLRDILYILNGQEVFFSDDTINKWYTVLYLLAEKWLQRKDFKDLRKKKPYIFDTILGNKEGILAGVTEDVLFNAESFYAELEKQMIQVGELKLDPKEKEVLESMDKAFYAYLASYRDFTNKVYANTKMASQNVLKCGDLVLDLGRATLQYKPHKAVPISIDTKTIKMLALLLNRGELVEYKDIANDLKLSYSDKWDNNEKVDVRVQEVRRELGKILQEAGMSKNEINSMIKAQKNRGYIINFHFKKATNKIS